MAKLATVLFSRKRKREIAEEPNKENHHPSTDATVITADQFSENNDDSPRSEPKERLGNVKFTTVQIHEHILMLGDNPAVSRGVPLTLAWERCSSRVYSVDEYEQRRQPKRRRNSLPLAYTPQQRETIAKLSGSSKKAIQFAGVRVKEIQQSREEAEFDSLKRGMWERIRQAPAMIVRAFER